MIEHLEHLVHRHTSPDGYVASCMCGWRVVERTRLDREHALREHELAAAGTTSGHPSSRPPTEGR